MLFECEKIQQLWREVAKLINVKYGILTVITYDIIMFGSPTNPTEINTIINHFKSLIVSEF